MAYYPAIVRSYDSATHRARIEIPGLTDGANTFPEAEILYPIGDLHSDTEVLIRPNDKVYIDWLIEGDNRTPIIVGYRNPKTGNAIGVRRIRQDVIEIVATSKIKIQAPIFEAVTTKTKLDHSQLVATGINTLQGQTNLDGGATTSAGKAPIISGGLTVEGGGITHNGTNVGQTHYHTAQGEYADTSIAK